MEARTNAETLAADLIKARESLSPVAVPINLSPETARQVRQRCIDMLTTSRSIAIGAYKVSLSTATWGALPLDSVHIGNTKLDRGSFFDPLLEGELAFLVERELKTGCTVEDVLESCKVACAIEIADSRWQGWCPSTWDQFVHPTAEQIEADNAVGGALVVGQPWVAARDIPLQELSIIMQSSGRTLAEGPLSEVMGNPAEAVRWLIHELTNDGMTITVGQIVSTGCPYRAPVTTSPEGGCWRSVAERIGTASVTFE